MSRIYFTSWLNHMDMWWSLHIIEGYFRSVVRLTDVLYKWWINQKLYFHHNTHTHVFKSFAWCIAKASNAVVLFNEVGTYQTRPAVLPQKKRAQICAWECPWQCLEHPLLCRRLQTWLQKRCTITTTFHTLHLTNKRTESMFGIVFIFNFPIR